MGLMRQRQLVLTVIDSLAQSRSLACILATAVCAVLLAGAAPAFAALSFPFDGQLAPAGGSFGYIEDDSVAVDDFNHDTYVADLKAGVVDVFDAGGVQLQSIDGSATPAGSFGGGGVSVAANNGTGDVYVLDSTHSVIDEFDSSGAYLCQITGSATPSASECNGSAGSDTPAHGLSSRPRDVVLDQTTGEVYVLDTERGVVDVFGVSGEYLRQVSLSSAPEGFPVGFAYASIAVSGFNGHLYVADFLGGRVFEFDASGSYVATWTGSDTPAQSFEPGELSVAVDDASGDVYITDPGHKVTDVFDPSGGYLAQFSHSYVSPLGTAVDQGSGRVYISDDVVDIFGPALVIPDVITGASTNVKPTSVTLNGTVNPDGIQLTDCHFDYGTDTSYGQTAPCVPAAGSISADSSVHGVSADINGLEAGVTYHFRLDAANANGSNPGEDAQVTTLPSPSIDGATAANVIAESADLDVQIDPNGYETTYHIEWGTSTAYGTTMPVPDEDIGAGTSDVARSQHLTELKADTTYHWRVVAVNANGTRFGADHTFVYDTTGGGLPDNRSYEMVTPPHKNAALIGLVVLGLPPDIAEDGDRMFTISIQCYASARSCVANRQYEGEPVLFTRTAAGWVPHALAPPASLGAGTNWLMNANTGKALFSISTPPHGEDDWYEVGEEGSFVDIGPATPPATGTPGGTYGAFDSRPPAATPDLSHIVWDSYPVWPFDESAAGEYSVYEYAGSGNTAPALVGVTGGAGSHELISRCGTGIGGASNRNSGVVSLDGKTVYFTTAGHLVGCPKVDELYARLDGSSTVAISQRSALECATSACRESLPADANYEDASLDGTKVFFTDTQQLTDSASEDPVEAASAVSPGCKTTVGPNGCNLYEYDFSALEGRRLSAVSLGDSSGGGPRVQRVMRVSGDGSHVYFVAGGVLTQAPNGQGQQARDGAQNMYVFERDAAHPEGTVAFIATLPPGEEQSFQKDQPSVTPDGRYVVFTSRGRLTADDTSTSGAKQVFRYDAVTQQLIRISVGDNGFNDDGNTFEANLCESKQCSGDAIIASSTSLERRDQTMSHDGSFVFFQSPVGLTPQALDRVQIATREHGQPIYAQNVYEWHEGHVYLISDGRDTSTIGRFGLSSVELIGADATGANVFFSTTDSLVPTDTDTQLDYYDARICTAGDPCVAPPSPVLPPCLGEACHGTPAAQQPLPSTPSAAFDGQGNLFAPVVGSVKPRGSARARRLAAALRACRAKRDQHRRAVCERRARAMFGVRSKQAEKRGHK
jgi:DNA-binding beta-propeller fold protein YncE